MNMEGGIPQKKTENEGERQSKPSSSKIKRAALATVGAVLLSHSVSGQELGEKGKIAIPKPEYDNMIKKYNDSAFTNVYTIEMTNMTNLKPAVTSAVMDSVISDNETYIKNTSQIKPAGNKKVVIEGKTYNIPQYQEPSFDPSSKYVPIAGVWETVDSKLRKANNYIEKKVDDLGGSKINRLVRSVTDPIENAWKNWHPFGETKTPEVTNKPVTVTAAPQSTTVKKAVETPKKVVQKIQPQQILKSEEQPKKNLSQYNKIVNGKKVPITKEEYDSLLQTGHVISQETTGTYDKNKYQVVPKINK